MAGMSPAFRGSWAMFEAMASERALRRRAAEVTEGKGDDSLRWEEAFWRRGRRGREGKEATRDTSGGQSYRGCWG